MELNKAQDMVILELRQLLEKAKHDADRYALKLKELTEENERLQTICESYALQYGTARHKRIYLDKERADTVREFAERLKKYYSILNSSTNSNLVAYHIDQVAKEMLEKQSRGDNSG